ncbi:hypothetical protein [Saprospira grandis]|uniref:Uncharacterized protein n=1 Tax=Saprospira grandis (strain Lewin) TaxID=984262 RepID=H6L4K9_SAPGL|nr:hypothetical protein [Saprospira grandis]AFC23933.1 hypothetical protein SGRA_1198 [Saprospira grandis str. Lewin]
MIILTIILAGALAIGKWYWDSAAEQSLPKLKWLLIGMGLFIGSYILIGIIVSLVFQFVFGDLAIGIHEIGKILITASLAISVCKWGNKRWLENYSPPQKSDILDADI